MYNAGFSAISGMCFLKKSQCHNYSKFIFTARFEITYCFFCPELLLVLFFFKKATYVIKAGKIHKAFL